MRILRPSSKRHNICTTHKYINSVKYVVCEDQADSYRSKGLDIIVCPNKEQGNVSRVRNWILNKFIPSDDIVIVDDDMSYFGYFSGNKHKKINSTDVHSFLNYGFNLAKEFNCKYWGLNLNNDKGSYREYSPFSLKSVLLGPFGGFIKGFDCRYDEKLPLKEDYDLSIQALNKYRKILRVNFEHYVCKQHTNEGGCASYRTINREKKQLLLLQKKWGKSIVKEDTTKKKNSNKVKTFDINPVIKVPIGGI